MQTIRVETPSARYEVLVGSGLIESLGARLKKLLPKLPRRIFLVTSSEIWALWGEAVLGSFTAAMVPEPVVLFLPAGEKNKTLANVEKLARQMVDAEADRGSLLIAFGGGIVGDVCGFLAGIYMRGISYIQIPTTLLAQVDSSVGGKTGVNLPEGKNLVGAFHHPLAVYADIDVLGTLDERELRAGLMESVKAGFIRDRALVRFMEENADAVLGRDAKALEKVIAASVKMKAEVVGLDEREGGLRMILNLGHTLGHAIEQATGYKTLLHGEAVGWGMIAALYVAVQRRTITPAQAARMEALIHRYCPLPHFKVSAAKLVQAATGDKKNVGGVKRFVVPVGVGDAAVLEDVSAAELEAAAKFMLAQAAQGSVLR
jgi:3-dehydroquinate synthase